MIFLSYWFVFFVLCFFPIYWVVRHPTVRLYLLLASCVVFYTHFAGVTGVIPIIILGIITYVAGYVRNKSLCIAAAITCVASLIFYKYTKFLVESLLDALSIGGKEQILQSLSPIIPEVAPLAISFFVFEYVHYLYDVIKGEEPIKNGTDFILFATFWPSVVAGPIKRYQQFIPELRQGIKQITKEDISYGLTRVAIGIVKKIAADNLTIYITFWAAGERFALIHPVWRWLIFLLLGLRIYWDFSGYSDMAIGYSRLAGIKLPENFNWPYVATSLADFWHRWHISLSQWIRDYIYIPLGGNRHGLVRKATNALIAFGICGLWHGAAWNFLVWGLYHGVGLAISSNYRSVLGQPGKQISDFLGRFPGIGWVMTMAFVWVGWLIFFYPLPTAFSMLQLMFSKEYILL